MEVFIPQIIHICQSDHKAEFLWLRFVCISYLIKKITSISQWNPDMQHVAGRVMLKYLTIKVTRVGCAHSVPPNKPSIRTYCTIMGLNQLSWCSITTEYTICAALVCLEVLYCHRYHTPSLDTLSTMEWSKSVTSRSRDLLDFAGKASTHILLQMFYVPVCCRKHPPLQLSNMANGPFIMITY